MTRKVKIDGEIDTATGWCRRFGVSRKTYQNRRRRGWSKVRSITTPVAVNGMDNDGNPRHSRKVMFNGTYKSIKEHCRDVGIPYHRVYQRIAKLGWTVKKALTEPIFGDGMFGQKKSRLRVICEDTEKSFDVVRNRKRALGWSLSDALSIPKLERDNPDRYPGKSVMIGGEKVTRAEASRRLGGCPEMVHARMRIGWTEGESTDIPRLDPREKYVRTNANRRRNELITMGIITH